VVASKRRIAHFMRPSERRINRLFQNAMASRGRITLQLSLSNPIFSPLLRINSPPPYGYEYQGHGIYWRVPLIMLLADTLVLGAQLRAHLFVGGEA
jgi:hypothetical protein